MKRTFLIFASVLLIAGQSGAQEREGGKYYQRGLYLGVETSVGASFSERKIAQPDYGVKAAVGMRLFPQLVVAVAGEGTCNIDDGTNSLPLSLHLRSDFLDRKITPFVTLDLGYAFQFGHSRCTEESIKVNDEVFTERLGDVPLDEYLSQFPDGPSREQALSDLKRFSNGSFQYISAMHADALQFSKEGLFCTFTLGASFNLPQLDRGGIFIGLSGGIAEYAENLWMRTLSNRGGIL